MQFLSRSSLTEQGDIRENYCSTDISQIDYFENSLQKNEENEKFQFSSEFTIREGLIEFNQNHGKKFNLLKYYHYYNFSSVTRKWQFNLGSIGAILAKRNRNISFPNWYDYCFRYNL